MLVAVHLAMVGRGKGFRGPEPVVVDEGDGEAENLNSLHGNDNRRCLATLVGLNKLLNARRRGVDPGTDGRPRTRATRELLRRFLTREHGTECPAAERGCRKECVADRCLGATSSFKDPETASLPAATTHWPTPATFRMAAVNDGKATGLVR